MGFWRNHGGPAIVAVDTGQEFDDRPRLFELGNLVGDLGKRDRTPLSRPFAQQLSLLNHDAYPSQEVVGLYHARWELEVAFDEIKTHLLNERVVLRSRTVEGTYQEIWGALTLYNLLRREMMGLAQSRGLPSNRVSFTGALLLVQNFFISSLTASPGTLTKELAQLEYHMGRNLILPPRRSESRCPRHVKVKMSNYPKAPPRRSAEPSVG